MRCAIVAKCDLDWDYVLGRARRGSGRVRAGMLFAQSSDLAGPDHDVAAFAAMVIAEQTNVSERGDSYLPEHLHAALLSDGGLASRRATWVDENCIHIADAVATADRRDAIVAVVNELASGWDVCNDVEVVAVDRPPDVEDVTG